MIYTPAEKEKLDKVFAAFQGYIQQHTCFDILYSDKIGYIQLLTEYPRTAGNSPSSILQKISWKYCFWSLPWIFSAPKAL